MKSFLKAFFVTQLFCSISFAQNLVVRVRTTKNSSVRPQLISDSRIAQQIIKKDNGLYDVITLVSVDDYLAGVLSKEMPLSWPEESLKAQAVVARSFLLARMNERAQKSFHVESDQMDQVFSLTQSVKAYKAVKQTENIFLISSKNKILKAFYHSDCGGQTIPANQVWSGAEDSGTAQDPWCARRESNKWAFAVSADQFKNQVSELQIENSKSLVYKSKFVQFSGLSLQKLREIFGFSAIRNSPEQILVNQDEIIFKGQGYGHGAGLCQYGARYMAEKGRSFIDILRHYYPLAQISDSKMKLAQFKNKILSDLTFKM